MHRSSLLPVLLLLLVADSALLAQEMDVEWMRLYGGFEWEGFSDIVACDDGGFLAVGTTESYRTFFTQERAAYAVRTNAVGEALWSTPLSAFEVNLVEAVYPLEAGGWLLVGSVVKETPPLPPDHFLWLAQIDTAGRLRSETVIDSIPVSSNLRTTRAADGAILATVTRKEGMFLFSLTLDGAINWRRSFDEPFSTLPPIGHVTSLPDGGGILSLSFLKAPHANRVRFYRFTGEGEIVWTRYYDTIRFLNNTVSDENGNLILVSLDPATADSASGYSLPAVSRLDLSGALLSVPQVLPIAPIAALTDHIAITDGAAIGGDIVLIGNRRVIPGVPRHYPILLRLNADLQLETYQELTGFNLPHLNATGMIPIEGGAVLYGGSNGPANAMIIRMIEGE